MTEIAPVTRIQRQLWLADRLAPPAAYTVGMSWALTGDLDRQALRCAVQAVWARHPALRTTLREVDGELRQVISDPDGAGTDVEFSTVHDAEEMARARNAWGQLALDLEAGPVARVRVVSLEASDTGHSGSDDSATGPADGPPANSVELHLAIHHALCDEASLAIWVRDLFAAYDQARSGGAANRPPAASSLADIAADQQQPSHLEEVEEALDFWGEELAGAPAVTDLPRRRGDHDDAAQRQVGYIYEPLPDSVREAMGALRKLGFTSFQVVAAALGLTLGRYTGQEDLVIGTPVSGRLDPSAAEVMGMFASTTVLRLRPDLDTSAATYLGATRDAALDAMDFSVASFEQIVDRVRPERTGRSPLFQVMLAFNAEAVDTGSGGVNARPVFIPPALARFELTVFVIERSDGSLVIRADYQRDQLDDALVEAVVRDIGRAIELLADAGTAPDHTLGELPWSTPAQMRELTWDPVVLAPDYLTGPDPVEQIRDAASRQPDHVAVIDPDGTRHTYADLITQADRITRRLTDAGVGSGDVVAVVRPDGGSMVAAMLGTMAAGAVWAPLDPRAPGARRSRLIELAGAAATLTDTDEAVTAPGRHGVELGEGRAGYLYFTSGSTGEPKPVVVGMTALQNLTRGFVDRHRFGNDDVLLALPPMTFDAALGDIVPMLTLGGTLVLHPDPASLSGHALFDYCREHGVTAVDAPCALWQQWCADLNREPAAVPGSLRMMMIGGESASRSHVEMWQHATAGKVPLFNHYGPTEAAVCATVHEVGKDAVLDDSDFGEQGLSIGRSLPNVACYLVDRVGRPVPNGVVGELVIGGAGVATGYLTQSTGASPFVPDPFGEQLPGSRGTMYRTGDYAIRGPGGLLHFLGRRDQQVKILGRRIELGEIEAAIAAHPEVAVCAVTAPADSTGQRRLVAHVTPSSPNEADRIGLSDSDSHNGLGQRVREYLTDRLPRHLVPSAYLVSATLPMTDRGKVDRAALPTPEEDELRAVPYVAPRTPSEEFLAEVWAQEAGAGSVGRGDTFEDIGGTSLAAARVSGRIHAAHGVRIGLRDLIGDRTLESVAAQIDRAAGTGTDADHAQAEPESAIDASLDHRGSPGASGATLDSDAAVEAAARADLRLLDGVRPVVPGQRETTDRPRRVLLTGATGFLGVHLADSLVQHGAARVHALVRAADAESAKARVATHAEQTRLPGLAAEISVGVGDLAADADAPGWVDWAQLVEEFDTIVNVGGLVQVDGDYAGHRGPNVLGPARMLTEAMRAGTEVHHVSTLGVFWSSSYAQSRVSEADSPGTGFPFGGYNQSKWVSDLLAIEAGSGGLPVTVHRPARLTTAWGTGVAPSGTWWSGMLSACRELRLVPDLAFREDLLPVDWVADAMARLILSAEHPPVVHYWSGDTLPYPRIAEVLAERDAGVRLVDYAHWHADLMDHVARGGARLFAPFIANLAAPGTARKAVPDFDASASLDLLRRHGAADIPAAAELLRRELDVIDELERPTAPTGGTR